MLCSLLSIGELTNIVGLKYAIYFTNIPKKKKYINLKNRQKLLSYTSKIHHFSTN